MRLANRRLGYCVNADSRRLTVFSLLCAQLAYLIDRELYDIKVDGTELATSQPDKAKELTALWNAWAERAHVTPYPGA